ncbi:MAG TPA: DUF2255 family protein [Actinocrinis sp.]|nr:DUF2255 family protein [Actinocrinis sp.]
MASDDRRTVLIIGISRGIGRGLTAEYLRRGWSVKRDRPLVDGARATHHSTSRGSIPRRETQIMTVTWSSEQLERIGMAEELQIASRGADGALRRWTPIWVVSVGEQVYVRTWYRRRSGWFGHVLDSRRACIRVPGLEADVTVEDAGVGIAKLREDIDAAYRTKYGRDGRRSVEDMVSAAAAAATLRLSPEPSPGPSGSGRAAGAADAD